MALMVKRSRDSMQLQSHWDFTREPLFLLGHFHR